MKPVKMIMQAEVKDQNGHGVGCIAEFTQTSPWMKMSLDDLDPCPYGLPEVYSFKCFDDGGNTYLWSRFGWMTYD